MESMDSVKTPLLEMLAFFQEQSTLYSWWDNRYSTALVVLALTLYRLFVIRNEIQRRRRDIGHGHLETVFNPATADFEIIAVQGLGSDPNSTWKSKQAPVKEESDLLEKLLPQRLPNARISKFIYNSDLDYDGSVVSPKQLGENLVDAFERHVQILPLLPIVFICHSFGGIVTKYALLEAGSKSNAKDQNIWGATRGIIFLGTPHQGSSLSSFALAISYVNRFFGSRGELVAELQPSNQSLIDLVRDFQNQLNNDKSRRVRIHSVQEMKQVMLFGLFSLGAVVGQSSAMMHAHKQSNWNCSHTELNKFPGIEDQRFRQLIGCIEELAPSSILQKIDKRLCELYRSSDMFKVFRFSKEELDMDNCFINLGRIENTSPAIDNAKTEPLQQSLMARLRLEETGKQKRLQLWTLFDQEKPGEKGSLAKRFLIRGQAGIGKSTLCKKILHEFYTKSMWRMNFDRILWIPLRKVTLLKDGNRTPEKLLTEALFTDSDIPLVTEMMEQLELDNFNRTLFLLDGMDEVHHLLGDRDRISKQLLTSLIDKPNVIVTSRPHSRVRQREIPFDIEAEVLGFTPTQVDDYISKSGGENREEIREFLQNNLLVQSLVRIPIQLDAMCYTWNLEGTEWDPLDPPRTMTELYHALEVKFQEIDVVRRKGLEKEDLNYYYTSETLRSFQDEDTNLMESLAFAGLCLHEVNFDSRLQDSTKIHFKIRPRDEESVPSILHDLSFFRASSTVLQSEGFRGTYHFLHLTFQEYFAARYFVRHWKDEKALVYLSQGNRRRIRKEDMSVRDFLRRHKYLPSFDVFWRFVSGLLKPTEDCPKDLQNDFFMALESDHRDELGPTHQRLVMHCLAEARCDMPLRIELESTLSEWLCFELRESEMHSQLVKEAEFPDSSVIAILQQPPSEIQSYVLTALAGRSHLSGTLLEILHAFATRNADDDDVRQAAYTVLEKHKLPLNMDPHHKIGLVAMQVLAKHGRLQDLASDVIKSYLEDKDLTLLLDLMYDSKAPPQIVLDYVREWRRDSDQEHRVEIIHSLKWLTNMDQGLFESCLAPLEDDGLQVLAAVVESLQKQPSLTPTIWQALVKYVYIPDFDATLTRALRTTQMFHETDNDYSEACEYWLRRLKRAREDLIKAHQERGGLDLASLLVSSERSMQKFLVDELDSFDCSSPRVLHALIKLLECNDMQIFWGAFRMLATEERLSKVCLDTMSEFLQYRLQHYQESWEMVRTYFFHHGCNRRLSDKFLQSLAPLCRTDETPVTMFCMRVLSTQSPLPPLVLDVLDRTFQHFHNTNHNLLQLFEDFKVLPELVEEAIASLLGVEDNKVRSKASRILQHQGILRQSTLQTITGYLQNSQKKSIRMSAIEALRWSTEIPCALWNIFERTFVEDDQETRQHIYSVLETVENLPDESWNRLTQVLERRDPQVRREFFDVFLERYQGVLPESKLQYIISLFPHNSENQQFRTRIASYFGPRIYKSSFASYFITSLLDDDHQVKLRFVEALDDEPSYWEPDFNIILPLLKASSGNLQLRILNFLRSKDEAPVTDDVAAEMVLLLEHESEQVRECAGYVLARHNSEINLHIIATLLRHPHLTGVAHAALHLWKTRLPDIVLDVLAEILEDRSVDDDIKKDVLDIIGSIWNHETKYSKLLASKILPLLENTSLAYPALTALWEYGNLSRNGLDKSILKVHRPEDQKDAFELLLRQRDEVDLSSFVNNPHAVGKFFEMALSYSWDKAVSVYFMDKETIQINTPFASKTVTLENPEEFRILVQKERDREHCPNPGIDLGNTSNARKLETRSN